ncbi:hypothetical protein FH000_12700 [Listeria monocytogenes]|nr:hypothetical protein [Listeria monocytogenes]
MGIKNLTQKFIFEYEQEDDLQYSELNQRYQEKAVIPFQYDQFIGLQCTDHLRFWKWKNLAPCFFEDGYKKPREKAFGWLITIPFECSYEKEAITTIVLALMERLCITFVRLRKDEPYTGSASIVRVQGQLYVGSYFHENDAEIYNEMMKQLHFKQLV